jgi:tRNA G10  N-methylase Trm11
MKTDLNTLDIVNPKRDQRHGWSRQNWYPFYASFSLRFAESLLSSARLPPGAMIVDPWNGTGTSSLAAATQGYLARGFDLNPAMVIAARGKLLSDAELLEIHNASRLIFRKSPVRLPRKAEDPLSIWFSRNSVTEIRTVQRAFHQALGDAGPNGNGNTLSRMPKTTSFFYIALFRTVRHFLSPFFSSNPTWIKRPRAAHERIHFPKGSAFDTFASFYTQMLSQLAPSQASTSFSRSRIDLASADSLPLRDNSVDLVLTSPPYCTRIDYAIATMPELAVLGYGGEQFACLRRALTGTLTITDFIPEVSASWGQTCLGFLKKLRAHPSKASGTYYLKTHLQYFEAIERSLNEIHRIMRNGAQCVFVVQDSYYKDVLNDLPTIFAEMAEIKGLRMVRRQDFKLSRTMVRINPRTKKYRPKPTAVESVLCFAKP